MDTGPHNGVLLSRKSVAGCGNHLPLEVTSKNKQVLGPLRMWTVGKKKGPWPSSFLYSRNPFPLLLGKLFCDSKPMFLFLWWSKGNFIADITQTFTIISQKRFTNTITTRCKRYQELIAETSGNMRKHREYSRNKLQTTGNTLAIPQNTLWGPLKLVTSTLQTHCKPPIQTCGRYLLKTLCGAPETFYGYQNRKKLQKSTRGCK